MEKVHSQSQRLTIVTAGGRSGAGPLMLRRSSWGRHASRSTDSRREYL